MFFLILPVSNQCNWNWLSWKWHMGGYDRSKSKRQTGNIIMSFFQIKTHRVKIRSGAKSQHSTSGHLQSQEKIIFLKTKILIRIPSFLVCIKLEHSLFWLLSIYYDCLDSLKADLPLRNLDRFGNWNNFHTKDGQYRQKCYSHCSDRSFKNHQSLLVKGSGCLYQFHLQVWWYWVTISSAPE